jgi:UDPglucose 6-dehydrogenase
MKKIAVIGAGYVGLVTGACLAQKGNLVTIVENNPDKITQLLSGMIPFYEPNLDTIVQDALVKKTVRFVCTIAEALSEKPDVVFSCVGTPQLPSGAADLSYVEAVAKEIGTHIEHYTVIVNKSTVPVGTVTKVSTIINTKLAERNINVDFDVVSNPEFLKEGDAVNDFLMPDRIIVGVKTERAAGVLYEIYKAFITSDAQFLVMSPASAELTKYAANAMLATRISFMNQLAQLADKVDADITQVKIGMAKDRRIGPHFLNAGIGYGGSCFPKDVAALVHMGSENHYPMTLIQEVENINHVQRVWFNHLITRHYGPTLATKTVGIWGLSFKPETDDIRCAPALDIIKSLLANGANVIAYDPIAINNMKKIFGENITYATTSKQVLENADFLVLLTEWQEFLATTPTQFLALKDKVIFDGRNCFSPEELAVLGLTYYCVGRNSLTEHTKVLLDPKPVFEQRTTSAW